MDYETKDSVRNIDEGTFTIKHIRFGQIGLLETEKPLMTDKLSILNGLWNIYCNEFLFLRHPNEFYIKNQIIKQKWLTPPQVHKPSLWDSGIMHRGNNGQNKYSTP